MKFRAKNSYWFTPDLDDNLKQPESKRLKAKIIRPDAETKNELSMTEIAKDYSKAEVATIRSGKLPSNEEAKKTTSVFRTKHDTGRILREHVPEIVNMEVDEEEEDGNITTRQIRTGSELAISKAFGVDRFVELLCAEVLRDKLPEETEKNSEPASS